MTTTKKPSIKRDGTVTLDGQTIGRITSRHACVAGRFITRYTPYDAAGNPLSTPVAYRKYAVQEILDAVTAAQEG
jgi:hypothetical protein